MAPVPELDAGADASVPVPEGSLELVGEASFTLAYGEDVLFEVRYRDADGDPVPRAALSFALVGEARDSHLAFLEGTTNEEGRLSNRLTAGFRTATFQVRVRGPQREALIFDAAVGDAGFGALVVEAPYAGRRDVQAVRVALHAGEACSEAMPPALRTQTVTERAEWRARFVGLPADASYTVRATALDAESRKVAVACREQVALEADQTVSLELALQDLPLALAGRYATRLDLDAQAAVEVLASEATAAGIRTVHTLGGAYDAAHSEAQWLLAGLVSGLREENEASAEAVAQRLEQDADLTTELQTALDDAEVGPERAVQLLGDALVEALGDLRLEGTLTAPDDGVTSWTWQLANGVGLGSYQPLIVELDPPSDMDLQVDMRWDRDEIAVEALASPVPWAALARGLSVRLLPDARSGGDWGVWRDAAGCTRLVAWAREVTLLDPACDACVRRACELALLDLVEVMQARIETLEAERPHVWLSGLLEMRDEDGDLAADTLTSDDLTGEWPGEAEGEALEGILRAEAEPETQVVPSG